MTELSLKYDTFAKEDVFLVDFVTACFTNQLSMKLVCKMGLVQKFCVI